MATLFVTANLNAGGAQRSLVNLSVRLAPRHALAVAVCGDTTHAAFATELADAGVTRFRPTVSAEPFEVAESLLAWAGRHAVATLCLWNVDAKIKLLLARMAPAGLRLIDVSPGHYAFEELEGAAAFGAAIDLDAAGYYARLDALVLKYRAGRVPACRSAIVIANGVARRERPPSLPDAPRFLVSGRLAPSKRLETVIDAFACVCRVHPAARLDIVGQAEKRHADYLARLHAAAAGLPVRFRGAGPDLVHLDEACTAAIVLGIHQGSPNAVLEAMSAGIAVIANASGGTGEMVRTDDTGWLLAENCDAAALAAAMLEAIAAPARTRRLALAGQAFVRAHHGLEAMAAAYLELLAAPGAGVPARDGIGYAASAPHACANHP